MATCLHALCLALPLLINFAVHSPLCSVNFIPDERLVVADQNGCFPDGFAAEKDGLCRVFPSEFPQLLPVFKGSCIMQSTPGRFHCHDHATLCPLLHSMDYTKLHVHVPACVHPIWLTIKLSIGYHSSRSKFGKASINYYPNSTATFNLPLAMSGDIEVNPGPVKDPCGNCNRPVKSNQRSLLCEDCSLYWHQKCIPEMNITQYTLLISSTIDWFCPNCLSASLPFSSCSDTSFQEAFADLPNSSHPSAVDIKRLPSVSDSTLSAPTASLVTYLGCYKMLAVSETRVWILPLQSPLRPHLTSWL